METPLTPRVIVKTPRFLRDSLRARLFMGIGMMLLPLFGLTAGALLGINNINEGFNEAVVEINEEMKPVVRLQIMLLRAAEPPNDYLVHGESSERDKFARLSEDVERAFKRLEAVPFALAEERASVGSAQEAWRQAHSIDETLLALPRPVGDAAAEIETDVAKANAAGRAVLWVVFGTFSLGLTLVVLVGTALARSILTRVRALSEGARAFGEGDFPYRVQLEGHDELGQLAQAFNAMADTLESDQAMIKEHTSQLAALNQIAVAVTSSLSLNEILDQIMRRGFLLIDAKAACIAFYDEATQRFTDWITHGLSEHFVKNMSFRPGGLADETFTTASYILSNDRPETKHKLSKLTHEEGLRCFVCLPLTSRNHRLGVTYFYRTDRDTFTPAEIELLTTFAVLAAQAIDNARLYAQSQEHARTDALTSLDNRREFQRRLDEEIERALRHDRPLSLLMLDLDHFKRVNDTYGHPAGDEVLRAIAARIRAEIRPTDRAARYGGEEFVAILPETPAAGARVVAERMRRAVAGAPFRLPDGREIGVTVSIGVLCCPDDANGSQRVVEHADQALYIAKETGRNRVVLYQETLKAQIEKDPARIVPLLNESLDNIDPLLTALSSKAAFFRGHTDAVEQAAARLAAALKLPEADAAALRFAARLHDLGMVAIPDAVLNRTSALDPGECTAAREHPAIAAGWLEQVPALKHLAPIVRHHHERYDGSGYPGGLKGEAIPFLARVLAVADAYSAMIADWPGRKARSAREVHEELRAGAGTQFDPRIVAAALSALDGTEAAARQDG
ncbi:MAG: diguanylate cyclase [Acidobacteriota bacterium]|nr:diguanylate cyclase [Acidobacteriota bacterium]